MSSTQTELCNFLLTNGKVNECCLTDGADVLYNKFNVNSSSPPDNPPQHPNSIYSCVVATTGQWRASRCYEQHRAVCQSDTLIGIITACLHQVIASRANDLACFAFFVCVKFSESSILANQVTN